MGGLQHLAPTAPADEITAVLRSDGAVVVDDLLRLLGYARGAYALGYVDGGRDPLDVVREREGSFGFGAG